MNGLKGLVVAVLIVLGGVPLAMRVQNDVDFWLLILAQVWAAVAAYTVGAMDERKMRP